jgi:hypothetical protein
MRVNLIRQNSIVRLAALAMFALCFVQLQICAQETERNTSATARPDDEVVILTSSIPSWGMSRGEKSRITVFNKNESKKSELTRQVSFIQTMLLDARGAVIAQSEEIAIPPGGFRYFDFHRDSIPLAGDPGTGRLQVSGQIRHKFFSIVDRSKLTIFPATVELVKETGQTTVHFEPTFSGGVTVASGDIDGSLSTDFLVGITPGQTLLITGLNTIDPESRRRVETVELSVIVYARDGNVIAESDVVEVPPGQFRTLRFNYEDLQAPAEPVTGRSQFLTTALWGVSRSRQFFGDASLEIVDRSTGRSTLLRWSKPKEIVVVGSK